MSNTLLVSNLYFGMDVFGLVAIFLISRCGSIRLR
ncbi:hypothetical protein NC651_003151 [Populus alba x Populus x berolinensis]|nr:hypothetical protein NC651_003151 [Populus alba x Populus x berolinensis]